MRWYVGGGLAAGGQEDGQEKRTARGEHGRKRSRVVMRECTRTQHEPRRILVSMGFIEVNTGIGVWWKEILYID